MLESDPNLKVHLDAWTKTYEHVTNEINVRQLSGSGSLFNDEDTPDTDPEDDPVEIQSGRPEKGSRSKELCVTCNPSAECRYVFDHLAVSFSL